MKTVTYKQLHKLPADTLFSTLSRMNELSEIWVIGEYPDGRRFLYSPLADVSKTGITEMDFDENTFNRQGTFLVWDAVEMQGYLDKLMGILDFVPLQSSIATEGAALYHPMIGGVATSANAANEAARATWVPDN
jgi:hypothetical protein